MIRPLIGGGCSECKASDENVGKRRCRHLLCSCSQNSLNIINIIQKHGGEAYLVGGCVRDMVLKEKPHDEDLTTSLPPDRITEIFEQEGFKVIPTGLQHGTVTVMMDGEGYEITTFRKETTYSDGRHPDSVTFSTNVEDDCSRRDFTFNAMYYDGQQVIDTYGGQKDIEDKVIRTVGDPDERFGEDALRMMRAIRFSSKLDFEIAPEVVESIKKNKKLIRKISAERIQVELSKTLMGTNRRYAFKVMKDTGLMDEILPEVIALKSVSQADHQYHYEDAYEHTMTVVDKVPDDLQLRYAALFHDLGKATCHEKNADGRVSFVMHEKASAEQALQICQRLKMSAEDTKAICFYVKYHNCPASTKVSSASAFIVKHAPKVTDEQIRNLQTLWRADWDAHKDFPQEKWDGFNTFNQRVTNILQHPHRLGQLSVNGNDAVEVGLKGKEVGEALTSVLQRVISKNETTEYKHEKYYSSKKYQTKLLQTIKREMEETKA